jgi:hypothetical protein
MRQTNKITAMILALCMAVILSSGIALAKEEQTPAGHIVVAVEKFTLGQGYVKEPISAPFYEGEKVGQVVARVLGTGNFYNGAQEGTDTDNISYVSKVKDEEDSPVQIPDIILQKVDAAGKTIGTRQDAEWLSGNDYTDMSGWMYLHNNKMASQGMSDTPCIDGDVVRLAFSVYDWGADLGVEMSYGTAAYFEGADKDALTTLVAQVNSSPQKGILLHHPSVRAAYNAAVVALADLTQTQENVDSAYEALDAQLKIPKDDLIKEAVDHAVSETVEYQTQQVPSPLFFKEWVILGLARSAKEVPAGYYEGYYHDVVNTLKEKQGILSESSYTEYARTILALTALGKDVTNVGGYSLLQPLADYDMVTKQGINGAIYALLAMDSYNYDIPAAEEQKTQTTREKLVELILKNQLEDGGFAIWGSVGDVDSTAMVLQALAKYQSQPVVAETIDKALTFLSAQQQENGGFLAWGSTNTNTESGVQVLLALSELGIDAAKDERFIKENGNLVSNIMELYVEGGGFKHTQRDTEPNSYATDQAMYAMAGYRRLLSGENSLYDMTDVTINLSLSSNLIVEKPVINGNTVTYSITAQEEKTAVIWIALYQGDVIEKVVRQPILITDGTKEYPAQYPDGYENSVILLWSGEGVMQPIAQSTMMGE